VTRTTTTTTRLIAEPLPNSNSRKSLALKPNLYPERSLWPSCFLFEEINALKRQLHLNPEKTANIKKRQSESILSTETTILFNY
jgi:hypothetical protein